MIFFSGVPLLEFFADLCQQDPGHDILQSRPRARRRVVVCRRRDTGGTTMRLALQNSRLGNSSIRDIAVITHSYTASGSCGTYRRTPSTSRIIASWAQYPRLARSIGQSRGAISTARRRGSWLPSLMPKRHSTSRPRLRFWSRKVDCRRAPASLPTAEQVTIIQLHCPVRILNRQRTSATTDLVVSTTRVQFPGSYSA